LDAELKLEYATAGDILHDRWSVKNPAPSSGAAPPDDEYQAKRDGDVWRFRYQSESASYPVQGNQCIAWLVKLLAAPNRVLTVAQLPGDAEGRIAADASIGSDLETDREGLAAIKSRIDEIDEIASATGSTDALEADRAQLLALLQRMPAARKMASQLKKDHANIATQLRQFRRKKLHKDMPHFAGHLDAALTMNLPTFGYFPPGSTPAWHF
jgi:hypothetical protein